METVNINGLNKAALLLELYNRAETNGYGSIHTPKTFTLQRAEKLLRNNPSQHFDYIDGRVLKVRLNGDEINPYLFDREYGKGAFARIVEEAREKYPPGFEVERPKDFFSKLQNLIHCGGTKPGERKSGSGSLPPL